MPKILDWSKSQPPKNEALSTIFCFFFGATGNTSLIEIECLTAFSQVFWDHLQIFSNRKRRPGNNCSGPQALWEQEKGWRRGGERGNVTSPKRAGPASSVKKYHDMTMTHSEGALQHQSETWPYGLERWGHDPAKKTLLNC